MQDILTIKILWTCPGILRPEYMSRVVELEEKQLPILKGQAGYQKTETF